MYSMDVAAGLLTMFVVGVITSSSVNIHSMSNYLPKKKCKPTFKHSFVDSYSSLLRDRKVD